MSLSHFPSCFPAVVTPRRHAGCCAGRALLLRQPGEFLSQFPSQLLRFAQAYLLPVVSASSPQGRSPLLFLSPGRRLLAEMAAVVEEEEGRLRMGSLLAAAVPPSVHL